MRIDEFQQNQLILGLEGELVCTVVSAEFNTEDSVTLVYKLPDNSYRDRLLSAEEAEQLSLANTSLPWTFKAEAKKFLLACEAKRMDLAFLFDPMMAIHTSNVQPLPHQITAVYESMLPRQPLRFVLADDPGAGKTIMAGLYMRELIMRADAERILIVAPGSLVDQWKEELDQKFGLEFHIFSRSMEGLDPDAAFAKYPRLIARLDQLSRDEESLSETERGPGSLQRSVLAAGWDLVVFDEAHKLGASYYGTKVSKTGRFRFAERLGGSTRHLLLMTATPHNGKDEDFQLFLSLLDSDRFYGKYREGAHQVETSDLMRRMVKEDMVTFEGKPLFQERKAYTINYTLSDLEAALYEAVTTYVKEQMGKADELQDEKRKGSVGFALTSLQRRLASSPLAIHESLKRRMAKLSDRIREEEIGVRGRSALADSLLPAPDDDDDLNAEEREALEAELVDQASAAQTIEELKIEVTLLADLVERASGVVASGEDKKWEELSSLLQKDDPTMKMPDGGWRKIIIFTEHKDTLNYLHDKIAGMLGSEESILTISGGTNREDRLKAQALFRSDPTVRVLIATDAAGEGVNLQCANLMVNYDLPWNPNRMEQRFGRIHRIGQKEVCHLWNLVAKETREGAVWHRLLEKLKNEEVALEGRVFNILGDVFEDQPLRQLLEEAIRYGEQPEIRNRLNETIDHAFNPDHVKDLLDRNALGNSEQLDSAKIYRVKDEMDRAEARRLQPHFVQSYFEDAFEDLGGSIRDREKDRFELVYVPPSLRERDRLISGRNRMETEPVLKRYGRVCFEKDAVQPVVGNRSLDRAVLLHPGHPVMLSMTDILLEKYGSLLREGCMLLDPDDDGTEPWLLLMMTHKVTGADGKTLSEEIQFVKIKEDESVQDAGYAPYLDLHPIDDPDLENLSDLANQSWVRNGPDTIGARYASGNLAPRHFKNVKHRRLSHLDKTLHAVNERLTSEIRFWTDKAERLMEDKQAGKDVRLPLGRARSMVQDLQDRLELRRGEINRMRDIRNTAPVIVGGAFVVPQGLIRQRRGEPVEQIMADAAAKKRVEMAAMKAVIEHEEALGHTCEDVSAKNCGWDITSVVPPKDGVNQLPRHIEVKGRVAGADTVTVSKNEIMYALNQGDKFILAIVFVDGENTDGPHYIRNPFTSVPDRAEAGRTFKIKKLLEDSKDSHD